jgi:hypothetical protein
VEKCKIKNSGKYKQENKNVQNHGNDKRPVEERERRNSKAEWPQLKKVDADVSRKRTGPDQPLPVIKDWPRTTESSVITLL